MEGLKLSSITSEFQLYKTIGNYLESKQFQVAYSVNVGLFHPREFDVVGLNEDKVVSIEVKLKNFKRTMEQAITRLYYSDSVMVAFPESYAEWVEASYLDDLLEYGIGLMGVNKITMKPRIIVEPGISEYVNHKRKKRLIDIINKKFKDGDIV